MGQIDESKQGEDALASESSASRRSDMRASRGPPVKSKGRAIESASIPLKYR